MQRVPIKRANIEVLVPLLFMLKIFTFILGLLVLNSCLLESEITVKMNTAQPITAITSINSPQALTLMTPLASPGVSSTATIQVDGVVNGDTVNIFSDSSCSNQVGSSTASGTSVNVVISSLAVNTYTFYSTTIRNGVSSSCSSASANYQYTSCPTAVDGNKAITDKIESASFNME
jgi:hypothetical protein